MFKIFVSVIVILPLLFLNGCSDESSNDTADITEGLLLHLTFEGNANDVSGNGNHGSLLGNATAAGLLEVGNNDQDALSLPNSVMNGLVDFTIAARLKINLLRNESHEWVSGANSGEDNALIIWYSETTNGWLIGVNDGKSAFDSDSRMEDGGWHDVAISRSGVNARLYLDGSALGTSVVVGEEPLDIDSGGLIFGQDQDELGGGFHVGDCWAGAMDNLRIYNRSLSAEEVLIIANETE